MTFEYRNNDCRGSLITWEGHELVVLENKWVRLSVSLTRGAEILELRDKVTDEDLLWHGHPDIVQNRGGLQSMSAQSGIFLENFAGGWQEIFPTGGDPTDYKDAVFGQHGEVALLPWTFSVLEDRRERIVVEFSVKSRRFPLALRRVVEIEAEEASVVVRGSATNLSSHSIPFMWGHHISIGGMWAAPGVVMEIEQGAPMTVPNYDWPGYRWKQGKYQWPDVIRNDSQPEDASVLAEDDGSQGHLILGPLVDGRVGIVSSELGRRVTFEWPSKAFPYSWCWFVYGGNDGWPLWNQHRLITVEPFTSPVENFSDLVERGLAPVIEPKGEYESSVKVQFSEIT